MAKRSETPQPIHDDDYISWVVESTDRVAVYFSQVLGLSHQLTPQEELQLGMIIAEGSQDESAQAIYQLMLANTRLVVALAKEFYENSARFLELIAYGNIGLLTAVRKFDYKQGNRFSTFAHDEILMEIKRGIALNQRNGAMDLETSSDIRVAKGAYSLFFAQNLRPPSLVELSEFIADYYRAYYEKKYPDPKLQQEYLKNRLRSFTPERLGEYYDFSRDSISFDENIDPDSDVTFGETLADPNDHYEATRNKLYIEKLLAARRPVSGQRVIDETTEQIIRMVFGLTDGGHAYSLEEIWKILDIKSFDKCKEQFNVGLRKLRDFLEAGNAEW